MAFERLRGRWERLTAPLLELFGWLRPNHLTWASLFAALAAASIVLMLGVLGAATQSATQWPGISGPSPFGGTLQWNSVSLSLTLCVIGGLATFVLRFRRSLKELTDTSDQSER